MKKPDIFSFLWWKPAMATSLIEIFRDSETQHHLSLFDLANLKTIEAGLFEKSGKPYLKCLATDKDRPAKPEEIVRQLWLKKLLTHCRPSAS
jgi:type I restriction enzyme M protein